jgi:hypothetical protein
MSQSGEIIASSASHVENSAYIEFGHEFYQRFGLATVHRSEALHVAPCATPKLIVFLAV